MKVWGISANSHDAALAVFDKNTQGKLTLEFASHSERFSGIKNDPHLNAEMISYAAKNYGKPDRVVWYEQPFKKTMRQFLAGQGWNYQENNIRKYLKKYSIDAPISYVSHHHAHAAAGYYTSQFADATIIVIDSIGEFETMTIWEAEGTTLKKKFSQGYPNSIGLWYSSMTDRVGLKANEDEYILMGMAAYGNPLKHYWDITGDFFKSFGNEYDIKIEFAKNLHRGCRDWRPQLRSQQDYFNIAAATQEVYEALLLNISSWALKNCKSKNLVLMGGCALNCKANSRIKNHWDNVWIMPNPGDAGSAIGAVLAHYKQPVEWPGPYLGFNINRPYPVDSLIRELKRSGIAGVANGRAEFGPRALGNRSLLADPRGPTIKHRVNEIKRRQQFRPFAPVILAEFAEEYFSGPVSSYMQYTAVCKFPDQFPAIVHRDGTSRVQTVSAADNSGLRQLLEQWYAETGCPMLLNTSLNIKGRPMVNTWEDGQKFARYYNVNVY
jgi:carbamoyltransferase